MSFRMVSSSFAGVLDALKVLALFGVERGIERKFRHAEDAVHGRADLVTHIGEEFTLGEVGGLRP